MRLNFEGPNGAGELEIDHEITVGRAPGNDLVLDDGQVSRRHVAFRPASDGIHVEDLGSYNGTFVNGERIASVVLAVPGDTIRVGETDMTVTAASGAAEAPPSPAIESEEPAASPALQAPDPSPPPPPAAIEPPPPVVETPPPPAALVEPEAPEPPPPPVAVIEPGPSAPEPPAPEPPPSPPPPAYEAPVPSAEPATMVGGWTPPATAVVPRLVVRTGRDDGKELALVEGREVMIGRDAASEFALTDARVSSRHARVRLDGEHLLVEDLGSANGTIVDGKRITGSEYAGESSEIQVGETVIVFTRQPSSFYASSPSPTLVGAAIPQIDQRAVAEAVEHAVEARERQDRPKTLMYTAIGGVVAIAIGVGLAAFFLRPTSDGSLKESDIVDREKFATLRIDAYDPNGDIFSGGSGSIIDLDKGFVLTNNHVASVGALKVFSEITKDSIDAELVAAAPCDDLALVRVPGLKDAVEGLRQVTFGDIAALKQGERVTALGYPGAAEGFLGRSLSATTGVVSKVKTVYDQPGSGLPFLINVIQTDAAINPGNSGGPLFDDQGHQVGVNTARFTGPSQAQNENYAISMDRVKEVLVDLKEGRAPKWIGLTFRELINTQTGDFAALGIQNITPGGPADEVGLTGADANGDARFLILGVNGTDVTTFHEYCNEMPDDGTVTLQIGDRSTGKVSDVEISVGGFGR